MGWIDGVTQCWAMANDCVIWWDAWAVVASLLAVIATAFLGGMTYRLGKEANSASQVALSISTRESEARLERDKSERLLILVRILPDVSHLNSQLENAKSEYDLLDGKGLLLQRSAVASFIAKFSRINTPNIIDAQDRLHCVGNPDAARIARIIGTVKATQNEFSRLDLSNYIDMAQFGKVSELIIPVLIYETAMVMQACEGAVRECGISDQNIANAAMALGNPD